MANNTIYRAMKAYRVAHKLHSDLKFKHDALLEQQRELLPEVSKAEVDANKAREVMVKAIQERKNE